MEQDIWEKKAVIMQRFRAAKERKKQRLAVIEQSLREDYRRIMGEEPVYFETW